MFQTLATLTTGRALSLLDIVAMAVVWPFALLLTSAAVGAGGGPAFVPAWLGGLLFPAANLVALYALGLYRRDVGIELRKSLARIPLVAASGAIAAGATLAVLNGAMVPISTVIVAAAAFLISGIGARVAFDAMRRRGLFSRTLLIVGAGRRAWDLVWMLRKEGPSLNYRITFVHDATLGDIDPRLADGAWGPVMPLPPDGFLGLAQRCGAEQVVVAPDERRGLALEGLLACKIAGIPVAQYLTFLEKEVRRIDLKRMELGWLLYSEGFYFGMVDRVLKRTLDLFVSAAVLLLLSPFLLAAMAAIKWEDGGPVLYRQVRVTRGGLPFRINKLRTMRVDAEKGGAVWAATGDTRITRIGALLRRTRIDELPQLFNVLRGEMSFVGPRPERPDFVTMLADNLPLYHERHVAKAGLTGWAQVNYPYGASIDDARSKLSYDLYYVKNFSMMFDLLIIVQTVRVVLWPGGVR
ncbi:MAG: TIGR03013 family PEP-CTERM/XrtA system glycosyltransferase [Gemmatimonadaceae bacterium]|nr:TIGR03013 family PEP-CTERM/XrtA system glycosyltransferase [Acetobacteraceae bacterium]